MCDFTVPINAYSENKKFNKCDCKNADFNENLYLSA